MNSSVSQMRKNPQFATFTDQHLEQIVTNHIQQSWSVAKDKVYKNQKFNTKIVERFFH